MRSAARTSATRTFPSRLSLLDNSLPETFPTRNFPIQIKTFYLTHTLFRICKSENACFTLCSLYLQYFFACAVGIVVCSLNSHPYHASELYIERNVCMCSTASLHKEMCLLFSGSTALLNKDLYSFVYAGDINGFS